MCAPDGAEARPTTRAATRTAIRPPAVMVDDTRARDGSACVACRSVRASGTGDGTKKRARLRQMMDGWMVVAFAQSVCVFFVATAGPVPGLGHSVPRFLSNVEHGRQTTERNAVPRRTSESSQPTPTDGTAIAWRFRSGVWRGSFVTCACACCLCPAATTACRLALARTVTAHPQPLPRQKRAISCCCCCQCCDLFSRFLF